MSVFQVTWLAIPLGFSPPLDLEENLWDKWHRFLQAGYLSCHPSNSVQWRKNKAWPQPVAWSHPFFVHQRTPGRNGAALFNARHTLPVFTGCEHGLFTGAVNMVVCNSFMPAPLHVLLLLQQWKTKTSYICVCYTCHSTSCLLEKTITTLRHAKICTNIFHFPSSHWRINCLHVICV